jgi:NAD(P)-dependent dehydrogenase (short-subunit alcohol dehydrogenase family)
MGQHRRKTMRGKICLITGGTSGIGKQTAIELARKGASIVLASRSQEKCEQTAQEIQAETGNSGIDYLVADLSSQADICRIASEFKDRYSRLDVLVNNAGAAFLRRQLSADGIEKTFALNHLGYFLLTNLLLEMMIKSSPARIVNVSSGSHFGKRLDFDDLELEKGYNPMEAYARSKLANIYFTYELDRRLAGTGVTATAINPSMVNTGIWRNIGPVIGRVVSWLVSRKAQTPEEGAQGVIHLASSPEVAGVSGKYFRKVVEMDSDPITYDQEIAGRLWEVSEKMTGL